MEKLHARGALQTALLLLLEAVEVGPLVLDLLVAVLDLFQLTVTRGHEVLHHLVNDLDPATRSRQICQELLELFLGGIDGIALVIRLQELLLLPHPQLKALALAEEGVELDGFLQVEVTLLRKVAQLVVRRVDQLQPLLDRFRLFSYLLASS